MGSMAGGGAGAAGSAGFSAVLVLLSGGGRLACAMGAIAALLASCAPVEQRRAEGTSWVVQLEQERLRLDATGFPQCSGPN